jgi:hypothetical protein
MPNDRERRIEIDIAHQSLTLFEADGAIGCWPVSTAARGVGEYMGSECTPRGHHRVRLKIGAGCESGTVFVGRRNTGERYSPALAARYPERDWILTRILWLSGCERGVNRGGDRDTLRRFIYIHGCPDTEPIGRPASHGCIRMRNADLLVLFDLVENGCPVEILAGTTPD